MLQVIALFASLAPALQSSGSAHLCVDALGYRPFEEKVAVLRRPEVGFDAPSAFTPGAAIELVRASDGTVAFAAQAAPWNGGALHAASGDRAWTFDFSAVSSPGVYFLRDAASGERSEDFAIVDDPAALARRAAVRVFYYQRSGFAKVAPFADPRWSDGASHLGPEQDLDCRPVGAPNAPGLDLSGGWYDAGDYNKYVNFADDAVQMLLAAYEANPSLFGDDLGLPESGDGSPDLLDEVRFELEWIARMQTPGGGVLHKVSVTDFSAASPPSADTAPRRYAPVTASATASAAAVFARAAYVYGAAPGAANAAFAGQMEARALAAWAWLSANPAPSAYANAGFSNVAAEDPVWAQGMNRVVAAAWLALVTGDPAFDVYVAQNYDAYPEYELTAGGWSSPYQWWITESLLRYAERATANPSIRTEIRNRFMNSMRFYWLGFVENEADPYRAWLNDGDHVWGSNRTRAAIGVMHAEAARFGTSDSARFAQAARDYAHYFHGVNALGFTLLTAAEEFGAENGVREMYHAWFGDGTQWDRAVNGQPGPAPGYLTGGPNRFFAPDPSYQGPTLSPPMGQPPAKSYRDWNTSWPQNSWEITEPSIGYQSVYVALLAHVGPRGPGEVETFCPQGPNVSGDTAHISIQGSTSAAANALELALCCAPPFAFAVFVAGEALGRAPVGSGTLCIASPGRLPGVLALDGVGGTTTAVDLTLYPFQPAAPAGSTWVFQAWHRDGPGGSNLSDAVRVTLVP